MNLANSCPANENGPILGLQLAACEKLVATLRMILGFDALASFADTLYRQGNPEILANNNIDAPLRKLYKTGKILQGLKGISVRNKYSRGINAGIVPVIRRVSPKLFAEVTAEGELTVNIQHKEMSVLMPDVDTSKSIVIATKMAAHACRYFVMTQHTDITSQARSPVASTASADKRNDSWCRFFTRSMVVTGTVIGMTAVIVNQYYSMTKK